MCIAKETSEEKMQTGRSLCKTYILGIPITQNMYGMQITQLQDNEKID